MKSIAKKMKYAALGLAVVTTAAWAVVTFDPNSGTGFVGKGDVQLVFGWNNAMLQSNALGVTFSSSNTTTYGVTCTWTTGEGTRGERTHVITQNKTTGINSAINGQPRPGPTQFTGFNLTGLGATTIIGGAIPTVGSSCIGIGADATVSAVDVISSSGTTLNVTANGQTVPLGQF